MSITLDKFFRALGLKPKRLEPIVEVGQDPEALAKTQEALPASGMVLEPGRELHGITTDDVDPRTGRIFPDFLARRNEREAKRKAQAESAPASIVNWNISPK